MEIDDTDREILRLLLRRATMPKAEVARRIGIAASAISERIKRLEERGTIRRYETRLNPRHLDVGTLAFIFIMEDRSEGATETGSRLSEVTGVEEVHKIAGEDCFLVKIRARDTEQLGHILDSEINPIPGVRHTRTTIVLRTISEDVPLGGSMPSLEAPEEPAS